MLKIIVWSDNSGYVLKSYIFKALMITFAVACDTFNLNCNKGTEMAPCSP